MRTNLSGAARATGATPKTLVRWIEESGKCDPATRAREPRYFLDGEAVATARTVGTGAEWSIDVDALARVAKARGIAYFNADAAQQVGRVPPGLIEELEKLRAERDRLTRDLERTERERERLSDRVAQLRADLDEQKAATVAAQRHTMSRVELLATAEPLPDGWIPLSTWCKDHGVQEREYTKNMRYPRPIVGTWKRGVNLVLNALDPALQAEAEQILAQVRAGRIITRAF